MQFTLRSQRAHDSLFGTQPPLATRRSLTRFEINPNTGEAQGKAMRRRIAVDTLQMPPEHPSHILLPVIYVGR